MAVAHILKTLEENMDKFDENMKNFNREWNPQKGWNRYSQVAKENV